MSDIEDEGTYDPEEQKEGLIDVSPPTITTDSNDHKGCWPCRRGEEAPRFRNWHQPTLSSKAKETGLRNYFGLEIIGNLDHEIINTWFGAPYNGREYHGGSKKDWPVEVRLYWWKWAFMLVTSMASLLAIYILTNNGTFGQEVVFTTNFLGNGLGIHTTTTVGVVPVGWLIGSAWAIPMIFGLFFMLMPYAFMRYVTGFVIYRYDYAFAWSWLLMLMMFTFVFTALVGASDIFVCLLTSGMFTISAYIFTVHNQHDSFNVYKFLGSLYHRKGEGSDVFAIDITSRPTDAGSQEIGAGHLSQEYISYLLADSAMEQGMRGNWFLHHEELVRYGNADRDTVLESLEKMIGDFNTILYPWLMKYALAIFTMLFGFVILFAYWIQNENTDATGFYWPITTFFWTFFVFFIGHFIWNACHYSKINRKSDVQGPHEPVLLNWLPYQYFTVTNGACWIFFQFCTWVIMAGLDKNGILYYSP